MYSSHLMDLKFVALAAAIEDNDLFLNDFKEITQQKYLVFEITTQKDLSDV